MIRSRHIAALAIAACLAQPTAGQGLETAARDAQRYVDCVDALAIVCLEELTYPSPSACDFPAFTSSLVHGRSTMQRAEERGGFGRTYWHVEPAAPVPIEADDERLYVFVPLRVVFRTTVWAEQPGYLLGVSVNNGESWLFIEHGIVNQHGIDRIVPGFVGPPPPDLTVERRPDPQPAESEYLVTRAAGFIPGTEEGSATVKLEFDVRKRVREALTLYTAFEDPQGSPVPLMTNSILTPRQDTVSLSLPPITGLRAGQHYEVVVFGLDPDTDDVVFEHRQLLRYFPVVNYFDEVLPAIAHSSIGNVGIFTSRDIIAASLDSSFSVGSRGPIMPESASIRSRPPTPLSSGELMGILQSSGYVPPVPGCE